MGLGCAAVRTRCGCFESVVLAGGGGEEAVARGAENGSVL